MVPAAASSIQTIFIGIICIVNMIWCLEKKVDKKNNPMEDTIKHLTKDLNKGLLLPRPYNLRLSCTPNLLISIAPAEIKSPALKRACVNKWNNIKDLSDKERMKTIKPKLERVELAISFFRSAENTAQNPPTQRVTLPISERYGLKCSGRIRPIRNNPAVTRVLLCTKAETGVGASIARGSHIENGYCALLVIDTSI